MATFLSPSLPAPAAPRRTDGRALTFAEMVDGEVRHHAERKQEAAAPVAPTKPLREYAVDIPEPEVGPLRFDDFPFQREWYSDEVAAARDVVLPKSAQVGASAWSMRSAIERVDQHGDTGIIVFPGDDNVQAFGDERIEPAIEASSYLRSRIPRKYVRTKRLKRIGRGFLHLRGSNSKAGAQSIAAQMIVLDERDLLDEANVAQILRRVSGAVQTGRTVRIRQLGYPYTPGAGIDEAWRSSDQRVWHVTCSECGDEQPVRWEENVRWTMPGVQRVLRPGADEFEDPAVLEAVWRCCRSCAASFEDTAPGARDGVLRSGRWIPQNPGASIIGFHAWRGMVPVTDLRALVLASRATKESAREAFSVLDLGRPYVSGAASLTVEALMAACALGLPRALEGYQGPNPVTMGFDVGDEKGIHVRIDEQLPAEMAGVLNRRRALWQGIVHSFDQLADLMVRFNVSMAAGDYNPERRMVRALRSYFPGRVIGVEYSPLPQEKTLNLKLDDAGVPLSVTVYRTDAIDAMMDSIRQLRSIPLKTPPPQWMTQMQVLRRVSGVTPSGKPVRRYDKADSQADDYAHAETYALVATELWRASGMSHEAAAAATGRLASDEEMGFRRMRLGMDGSDDYVMGLEG